MAAVKEACSKLPSMEADELRADTSCLLKNHCPCNKFNISKDEHRDIEELREDQSRVILAADKGVAMVVMEKQDYTDKALILLCDTSTYNNINEDPTMRLRNSLITKLKDIKQKGGLEGKSTQSVLSP